MKKIIVFLIFFFLFVTKTTAHPLDISASFLSFHKNFLTITTYFHSYEIEYLLSKSDIHTKSVYEYYDHQDKIREYITKAIKLKSGNEYCSIGEINILELEEYQILSKGLEISYHFECKTDIKSGEIEVYFFDNFPLQTNQITLYNLNDKTVSSSPIAATVLTSSVKKYIFDLDKTFKRCVVDSDGDGLSDEEEAIYKTNPNQIDTDNDFYTDYEELFHSWLPLDRDMGPRQDPRTSIPSHILENISQTKKTSSQCDEENKISSQIASTRNGILSNSFGNEYFVQTLETIGKYVKNESKTNILYILLIVVGLGFLHALGPGHSKSLLISYILDKNRNFFDGLLYISIFTLTHLVDIVVLFLITKVIFTFYDISHYMLYIQRGSLMILLGFSIYLIIKAYKNIQLNQSENCEKTSLSSTLFLGFVSGLAPCTFGWSIFLLLFSLGSFGLILPMIGALGLGIFLCLFCIMIATLILRRKVFEKISLFSRYSTLVSSSVLFFLSLYLFFILF